MADTASRLYGPTQLGTGAATIYTSPASTTTIVRHMVAVNTATVAAKLTISIGADAAGTRIVPTITLAPGTTFEIKGFIVLAAADILQAYSDTASAITLTVNGVKIT